MQSSVIMPKVSLEDWEDSQIPKNHSSVDARSMRKGAKRCPICTASIHKVSKGTHYERRCRECLATFAKELYCNRCNSNRVWRGKQGIYCQGCGFEYKPLISSAP